jgi:uncharacterized BrkB/YihY/UPF0761 family membrane protein
MRALVVAFVVAAIWTVLQKLGATVTVYISRRHAVYGALAGAALFLTWMYLLALLILLGATVLDTWARLRSRGRLSLPGAVPATSGAGTPRGAGPESTSEEDPDDSR